jgi:hypothetical protein
MTSSPAEMGAAVAYCSARYLGHEQGSYTIARVLGLAFSLGVACGRDLPCRTPDSQANEEPMFPLTELLNPGETELKRVGHAANHDFPVFFSRSRPNPIFFAKADRVAA